MGKIIEVRDPDFLSAVNINNSEIELPLVTYRQPHVFGKLRKEEKKRVVGTSVVITPLVKIEYKDRVKRHKITISEKDVRKSVKIDEDLQVFKNKNNEYLYLGKGVVISPKVFVKDRTGYWFSKQRFVYPTLSGGSGFPIIFNVPLLPYETMSFNMDEKEPKKVTVVTNKPATLEGDSITTVDEFEYIGTVRIKELLRKNK